MNIPRKIHLRDGENVIASVYACTAAFFWKYFFGILLLLVFSFYMFQLFTLGLWGQILYGLGMFAGAALIFKTWFFSRMNVFVITTDRIVDIHRSGLFSEEISSVGYLDIKDIVVKRKGIFAGLFNCGNLVIETKSQQFLVEVPNVRHPQKFQSLLSDTDQKYRQSRRVSNKLAIFNNFVRIIPDLTTKELLLVQKSVDDRLSVNKQENQI